MKLARTAHAPLASNTAMNFLSRSVNKIRRLTVFHWRKWRHRREGVVYLPPNYIFFDDLDSSSLVVDVGCGREAEFALYFLKTHGCRAIAVDPTEKHAPHLKSLESQWRGRLAYYNRAVAAVDGTIDFYESLENESGSVLPAHTNVQNDQVRGYSVEASSLSGLLEHAGEGDADLLKLDLEGAEYELLDVVGKEELSHFRQLFVEFHHHCVADRSEAETNRLVSRLQSMGLRSITLDDHNYLFYWPPRV